MTVKIEAFIGVNFKIKDSCSIFPQFFRRKKLHVHRQCKIDRFQRANSIDRSSNCKMSNSQNSESHLSILKIKENQHFFDGH